MTTPTPAAAGPSPGSAIVPAAPAGPTASSATTATTAAATTATNAPAPAPPQPAAPLSRARRLVGGPLLVVIVTGLVGFLLISQLRGTQRFSQRLSAENEGDLARILASLNSQADGLRDEISTLKLQLVDLEASSRNDQAAVQAEAEQLQSLAVLAGTVAVTGPGISLTIDDPAGQVGYDTMIDVVQELRDAGAEALAVNGMRVGANSSFTTKDGTLQLDGAGLRPPYRVQGIGQPATLEGGLKIPGGALDTLRSLKSVTADVQRLARVDLAAVAKPPTFRAAHPISSAP
jgi:uncharacterized protein YlxW (UPF0749 family)